MGESVCREGAESAGRSDESSHASPPAPAFAVGVMEGNQTPRLMENLMRISHEGERFQAIPLGFTQERRTAET